MAECAKVFTKIGKLKDFGSLKSALDVLELSELIKRDWSDSDKAIGEDVTE